MGEIADRITNILHPINGERLWILMCTPEFMAAAFRLHRMLEKLQAGEVLTEEQEGYLCGVEKHLKNIQPHVETMMVNGEEHEVFVPTIAALT